MSLATTLAKPLRPAILAASRSPRMERSISRSKSTPPFTPRRFWTIAGRSGAPVGSRSSAPHTLRPAGDARRLPPRNGWLVDSGSSFYVGEVMPATQASPLQLHYANLAETCLTIPLVA